MRVKILPGDFLILDLLVLPHEDPGQGGYEPPHWGLLVLKPPPYVAYKGPPGPLGVQVRVKLADLISPSEPLTRYKATVIGK